jgi:hypothetical protein
MSDITKEAARLFAERDKLERRKHEIDNRLRTLRALYMTEARVWGMSEDRFRQEVRAAQ